VYRIKKLKKRPRSTRAVEPETDSLNAMGLQNVFATQRTAYRSMEVLASAKKSPGTDGRRSSTSRTDSLNAMGLQNVVFATQRTAYRSMEVLASAKKTPGTDDGRLSSTSRIDSVNAMGIQNAVFATHCVQKHGSTCKR
jgi:hypothetical protein